MILSSNEISIIIASLSMLISLTTYFNLKRQFKLSIKSLKDNHEYNRRICALHLIERWDQDTLQARTNILHKWKDSFIRQTEIDIAEILAFRESQETNFTNTQIALHTITDDIQIIFNYFENIAIGIEAKIADETVVKMAFWHTFHRWFLILDGYRDYINLRRRYHPWEPVEKLFARWYPHHLPNGDSNLPSTGNFDIE